VAFVNIYSPYLVDNEIILNRDKFWATNFFTDFFSHLCLYLCVVVGLEWDRQTKKNTAERAYLLYFIYLL